MSKPQKNNEPTLDLDPGRPKAPALQPTCDGEVRDPTLALSPTEGGRSVPPQPASPLEQTIDLAPQGAANPSPGLIPGRRETASPLRTRAGLDRCSVRLKRRATIAGCRSSSGTT